MDPALNSLVAGSIAFVGTHFALSHPLRRGLVGILGEKGFLGVYSLVSFATLGWMGSAYRAVGRNGDTLWNGQAVPVWIIASLLTLVALVLLTGSFRGNPALPQTGAAAVAQARAVGVFAVTRHPMMWGIALWAAAHMLVNPTPRMLVLAGAFAVLALLGAHLQDRKKAQLLGGAWQGWEAQTAFWPRLHKLPGAGLVPWGVGVIAWLAITWAHVWLAYVPAGIWRWVG